MLTWKSLNRLAPYINQLLTPYMCLHGLSDRRIDFFSKHPKHFFLYGDRAFSSCAPKLWNSLPMDILSCVSILRHISSKLHIMFNCIDYIIHSGQMIFHLVFDHCLIQVLFHACFSLLICFCIYV